MRGHLQEVEQLPSSQDLELIKQHLDKMLKVHFHQENDFFSLHYTYLNS